MKHVTSIVLALVSMIIASSASAAWPDLTGTWGIETSQNYRLSGVMVITKQTESPFNNSAALQITEDSEPTSKTLDLEGTIIWDIDGCPVERQITCNVDLNGIIACREAPGGNSTPAHFDYQGEVTSSSFMRGELAEVGDQDPGVDGRWSAVKIN